jgi:hypothetical protein
MFLLGHVGIGRQLTSRWMDVLPAFSLAVGTLLPDLIDKPLYYARLWPFVSCTRTFGHTGILMLLVAGVAYAFRSRVLAALAAGVATHLLLDCLIDFAAAGHAGSAWVALTWPLTSREFTSNYHEIRTHLQGLLRSPVLFGEAVGLALLVWQMRQRRAAGPARL